MGTPQLARPSARGMVCILWVQSLNFFFFVLSFDELYAISCYIEPRYTESRLYPEYVADISNAHFLFQNGKWKVAYETKHSNGVVSPRLVRCVYDLLLNLTV